MEKKEKERKANDIGGGGKLRKGGRKRIERGKKREEKWGVK